MALQWWITNWRRQQNPSPSFGLKPRCFWTVTTHQNLLWRSDHLYQQKPRASWQNNYTSWPCHSITAFFSRCHRETRHVQSSTLGSGSTSGWNIIPSSARVPTSLHLSSHKTVEKQLVENHPESLPASKTPRNPTWGITSTWARLPGADIHNCLYLSLAFCRERWIKRSLPTLAWLRMARQRPKGTL